MIPQPYREQLDFTLERKISIPHVLDGRWISRFEAKMNINPSPHSPPDHNTNFKQSFY